MKQHVKVLLATGQIEHYYFDDDVNLDTVIMIGRNNEVIGYKFSRKGTTDFWSADMVKGIQAGPFKGFMLNIDGCEIYSESIKDEDIIKAVESYKKGLEVKLKAAKDYLSCKQST